MFPCNPKSGGQKGSCNDDILPAIERPLPVPGKLEFGREWREIGDGPGVAVWAAGADEVAKKMKMEAEEGEEGGGPGANGCL